MLKPGLIILVATTLAGCGTVIDFGPEPGTSGDEGHWHYQPELHGPDAVARQESQPPAPAPAPGKAAPAGDVPALPPPPPATAAPPAPTSEAMFNDAIRRAVAAGDIDRGLRLLEEAERLGSRSARPTFIEAVESRKE
ncbi:MAG TPA: hypothetical protein VMQ83_11475 [Gammaproteobacteria bacterium]|nr:hypothetical protein [Gammaproteobacteria bacterium]